MRRWASSSKQTEAFRTFLPRTGKVFSLDELQGFVGGSIEAVNVYQDEPSNEKDLFVMFVNEEGKLNNLVNVNATAFSGVFPNDIIVGDAIVCTLAEAGD